jgi:hypothetical protein
MLEAQTLGAIGGSNLGSMGRDLAIRRRWQPRGRI